MSERSSAGRTLLGTCVAGASAALAIAAIIAAVDAFALARGGVRLFAATTAILAAALAPIGLGAGVLAGALGILEARRGRLFDRDRAFAFLLVQLWVGSAILTLTLEVGTRLDERATTTQLVATALAAGLGAAVIAPFGGATIAALRRLLQRSRIGLGATAFALAVLPIAGVVALVRWRTGDFLRELIGPLAPVLVAAALVALAPAWWRGLRLAALPVALVALGFVGYDLATPRDNAILVALHRDAKISAAVLLEATSSTAGLLGSTVEGSASCVRGVPGPAVESVGHAQTYAPDIVLLTVDGVRWDKTSFGGRADLTPRLAELAKRGVVFDRAYAPAPSTRQSFRATFTGLWPGLAAAPPVPGLPWALSFADGQPTLASYLRAAGYQTAAFVSKPRAFPDRSGALHGFSQIHRGAAAFQTRHNFSASYKVNAILAHLSELPTATGPRFVWTHLIEPHFPFTAGPEVASSRPGAPLARHEWSIRYVDAELDRLLRVLLAPGRGEHTWVIVTADHGESFGERGFERHGSGVYEEEIHVPLVIWGPRVVPRRVTTPVSLIDLLPTIVEAATLRAPDGLCGQSLHPALLGQGPVPERPIFAAALPDGTAPYFELAWIDGTRKLVVDGHSGSLELYDLEHDRAERQNLTATEPARARAAAAALRGFLEAHGLPPREFGLGGTTAGGS